MNNISLTVNDLKIELDKFTGSFVSSVVNGILDALKTPSDRTRVSLSASGVEVDLVVNGESVPLNPFVNKIVLNTLHGMIATLRGVELPIENLDIEIS